MTKRKVTRFYRGARRHPKWDMGTPPDRSPRSLRDRVFDPVFYLRAAIIVFGLALFVLPLASDAIVTVRAGASATGCRIVSVTDGDTAQLYCSGRGVMSARLTGFDTPELFSPRCVSEFGAALRAKWALRRIVLTAGEITVVIEGTDRYGRALVFVAADGVSVARRMIEDGHARRYDGGHRQGWCAEA